MFNLKLQDKYNTCALSKHIGKYVYLARNAGKGSARPRLFPVSKPHTHITYICFDSAQVLYISQLYRVVSFIDGENQST